MQPPSPHVGEQVGEKPSVVESNSHQPQSVPSAPALADAPIAQLSTAPLRRGIPQRRARPPRSERQLDVLGNPPPSEDEMRARWRVFSQAAGFFDLRAGNPRRRLSESRGGLA